MSKSGVQKIQPLAINGPFAVSYLRFSTPEQRKGDSVRRQLQLAEDWSKRNDIPINETIRDAGVSAFRGKNALEGKLSLFLGMVKSGRVPRGTYFLVESLDRLSRDAAYKAFQLMFEIISSGIRIVSLNDDAEYSEEVLANNSGALFMWLGTAIRANQESVEKSRRVREAWQSKRVQAQLGTVLTARLPGWLTTTGTGKSRRIEIQPDRAAVVRTIFRMTIEGYGRRRIIQHLNANKITPFRNSDKWVSSNLVRILTSRAVLGELQPYTTNRDGKKVAQGDPVKDYFPPVVSEEDFNQAAAAMFSRRGSAGRRGPLVVNMLQGMVYCGACGNRMSLLNKGAPPKGNRYYVCSSSERRAGCTSSARWRADAIENAVLDRAYKIDWSEFDASATSSVAVTLEMKQAAVAKKEREMANLLEAVKAGIRSAIAELSAEEKSRDQLLSEIAELESEMARERSAPPPDQHEAIIQALRERLQNADPETSADLRTKISQTLKWNIDRIRFWRNEVAVSYRSDFQRWFRRLPPSHHVIIRAPEEVERLNREADIWEAAEAAEIAAMKPVKLPFKSASKPSLGSEDASS